MVSSLFLKSAMVACRLVSEGREEVVVGLTIKKSTKAFVESTIRAEDTTGWKDKVDSFVKTEKLPATVSGS